MLTLPIILPLPIIAAAAFFVLSKRVCWREFGVVLASVLLIGFVSVGASFCGATRDVEILNGTVVSKAQERVSCSHSYQCNCYQVCSGTGANRSCHQQCSTCYEHSNDWDWVVDSTIGEFQIDRIDRQGKHEPPRWTAVIKGEPASRPHGFTNYIKAAPGSILRMTGQKADFPGLLPPYPSVYDYYRVNHLIPVGVSVPNLAEAHAKLSAANGDLGPAKQVNVIFVIVKSGDRRYLNALEEAWLGGKKNDFVVVLGVPDGQDKIEWAGVMTWSDVELLKVLVRDEAEKAATLTRLPEIIDSTYLLVAKHFHRKPMAEFAYLKYQYSPAPGTLFFFAFLALVASVGLSIFFVREDPFDSGFRGRSRYVRQRW